MLCRSIKRPPNSQRHRCSRIANFTIPPSRYHKEDLSKTNSSLGHQDVKATHSRRAKIKKGESISCNPLSTVGRIYVIATTALDRYWSSDQYRRGRHATS
ncbi:hypothetical protein AVEN_270247-1 [Araneus ventricosus]|uniref:Uncharacterized protein n=1 Tax=Araneus ventricosus TaxID=182803 RepID=A0A4Y2VNY8_ARAVE|nr:hypothetical protein AVEN_270247-1 [Araneus ventricosus]